MPGLGDFNAQAGAGATKAGRHLPALAAAYQAAFSRLTVIAIDNLNSRARRGTVTAAVTDWALIDLDEVYDLMLAEQVLWRVTENRRIDVVRSQMSGTLATFGLSFDAKNPLIAGVLEAQFGAHIRDITEAHRDGIMRVIQKAHDDGLSIFNTVKQIQSHAAVDNALRGMRIARTEIVGASNGGSLAAARLCQVAEFKQWMATLDGRVRYDHAHVSGQVRPLAQPFMVAGYAMQHPGDQDGPASETVNCRCTLVYTDKPGGLAGTPSPEQIEQASASPAQQALDQKRIRRQRGDRRRIDRSG